MGYKEIDFSVLPNKIHKGRVVIDWEKSIGLELPFIYDDIQGSLKILNYYRSEDNKRIYLGVFSDFEEAVKTRKEAENKYYKEYKCDN